jgi:hypothetical protein
MQQHQPRARVMANLKRAISKHVKGEFGLWPLASEIRTCLSTPVTQDAKSEAREALKGSLQRLV